MKKRSLILLIVGCTITGIAFLAINSLIILNMFTLRIAFQPGNTPTSKYYASSDSRFAWPSHLAVSPSGKYSLNVLVNYNFQNAFYYYTIQIKDSNNKPVYTDLKEYNSIHDVVIMWNEIIDRAWVYTSDEGAFCYEASPEGVWGMVPKAYFCVIPDFIKNLPTAQFQSALEMPTSEYINLADPLFAWPSHPGVSSSGRFSLFVTANLDEQTRSYYLTLQVIDSNNNLVYDSHEKYDARFDVICLWDEKLDRVWVCTLGHCSCYEANPEDVWGLVTTVSSDEIPFQIKAFLEQ